MYDFLFGCVVGLGFVLFFQWTYVWFIYGPVEKKEPEINYVDRLLAYMAYRGVFGKRITWMGDSNGRLDEL